MCGIFGVINTKERIDEGRVIAARDILAYRGPDDAGIYFSNGRQRSLDSARDDGSASPFVALAHRRLSIIDLTSAAHQPMGSGRALSAESIGHNQEFPESSIKNQESRYVIVFNGEIYNFRDLISHLPSQRSHLTSNSDTEVILNLYSQYGKDCLSMLRGMFAFAIWDDKEKTLFAARDRFGIKPFYFLKNDNEFIFSSELKAIKHYKGSLTHSMHAIDAFLRSGSVPAPLTIYNEVSSLLPGHYLTIKPLDTSTPLSMTIKKYWEFTDLFSDNNSKMSFPRKWESKSTESVDSRVRENDRQDISSDEENDISTNEMRRNLKDFSVEDSFEMTVDQNQESRIKYQPRKLKYDSEAKKKIRAALLDSVGAHLVSDVEVGAFLSGGIDSTAIVSLMRQVGQEKIKTVSVVFPNNKLDESKYSRLAAKYYKTEHIEIPFYEKDLIDDFEKIMDS
ncbi:MAG: asparagine synthetase B, partial [Ignavibacteria bacterium]|nr:asparagine synthetase B [Ignavibacteria bacterium]